MWIYILENYSYVALAFAQRQVLLSLLGFLLMLTLTGCWRRASAQSLLSAWLLFWIWMLPLSLFDPIGPTLGEPGSGLDSMRDFVQHWIPKRALSPCGVPYLERMSADFPLWPLLSWPKLILAAWLLFAAAKLLNLIWQRNKLARVARHAQPATDPQLIALVESWRRRYRIARPVSVRSSNACQQAFTIGVVRPVIFLPENFLRNLNTVDMDAVLGHELAHIKRYDDIFVCLQLVTKSVLLFNPLIWLSARRITSLRERRCDSLAIETGHLPPETYAKSLLRIAELQGAELSRTASQQKKLFDGEVASGLTVSALTERVSHALASDTKYFSHFPLLLTAAGLLLLSIAFMPNPAHMTALRGSEAKILLGNLGASAPMARLSEGGVFVDSIGNNCGFPRLGHYHPGADFLPGSDGNRSVRSIADGEIIGVARYLPHAGMTLRIKHANNVVSTYVHLGSTSVHSGDYVRAGQIIGSLDDGHLHLEVRQGLRVVDPSVLPALPLDQNGAL